MFEFDDRDRSHIAYQFDARTIHFTEQSDPFVDRRLGPDDGDLADIIEGDDGRSLRLGHGGIKKIQLGNRICRTQCPEHDRAHGSRAVGFGHIEQFDHLPQFVETRLHSLGDD